MSILRVLGFGLFLLTLMLFLPSVFTEFSRTIIVFLRSAQEAFAAAGILASYAGAIPTLQ